MLTIVEDSTATVTDWSELVPARPVRWEDAPPRDELRSLIKQVDAEGVVVSGSTATLSTVVEALKRAGRVSDTPVGFLPGVPADRASAEATLDLVELLALPTTAEQVLVADPVALPLARNDIGGVLLVEAVMGPERGRGFGAQAYHDDQLIADGIIGRIDVRVDYREADVLRATVRPTSGRKRSTSSAGRAVQIACDEVPMRVDGRGPVAVKGRTWYLDDRQRWLLRGAQIPMSETIAPRPTGRWWSRIRGG
ncbi:hypothetical protein [Blastococcus sp. Marseille-P5729]|uniref:hypothetical protein n=1 Tax=Blastococcus sp. Marseille-P5729 TaxID=2086582 RepID=UPI000D0FD498|nr:hypothetical protein [Blastococcus sp. Marseille-P5729]